MNSPPKIQAPEAAPECAALAPELDSIADIVEPDDLFFGMIPFADNTELLDVEAGRGQLLHGGFRCFMVCEDGDDCTWCFH
jgi:hypothetical protein